MEILLIFLFYFLPMVLIFRGAHKMHKKYRADDAFRGSHTVAALIFIAIIPIVNFFIGGFIGVIQLLEKSNKN